MPGCLYWPAVNATTSLETHYCDWSRAGQATNATSTTETERQCYYWDWASMLILRLRRVNTTSALLRPNVNAKLTLTWTRHSTLLDWNHVQHYQWERASVNTATDLGPSWVPKVFSGQESTFGKLICLLLCVTALYTISFLVGDADVQCFQCRREGRQPAYMVTASQLYYKLFVKVLEHFKFFMGNCSILKLLDNWIRLFCM